MQDRKILFIDVSQKKTYTDIVKNYCKDTLLAGPRVACELLYKLRCCENEPFSQQNPIILSVGSLVGVPFPGAIKISGTTKMPVIAEGGKHFFASSVSGGRDFCLMLKATGYEHVVISGASEDPIYLYINNSKVEFLSAKDLWGKDTENTVAILKEMYGSEAGCLSIGPAGENLVRYAMAMIDLTNSLGRSGLGAVFGSKKIKAIVLGNNLNGTKILNPQRFENAVKRIEYRISDWDNLETWRKMGMGGGWSTFKYTQYPGKWSREKWDKLYGMEKRMETMDRIIGCASCRIACRSKWKIRSGEFVGEVGLGSPYGKSATSGQLLDIEDHRKTIHLVTLANKAGIDFYTFTRLLDWVTAAYENGLLNKDDAFGEDLSRTYDNYLRLLQDTINNVGFGSLMANGWLGIGEKTGLNPQDYWYAGICKGVDFIYDARSAKFHPLMMTFFTNPRPHHGGAHSVTMTIGRDIKEIIQQMKTWGVPEKHRNRIAKPTDYSGRLNVGRYTKWMEDAMMVRNGLGICSMYSAFGMEDMNDYAEAYSSVTGIETTSYELMIDGEKGFTYKKLLNANEGFSRVDDKVPELWLRPMNSPDGVEETTDYYKEKIMTKECFDNVLDDYYDERGWDIKTGLPTKEKLISLDMLNK